MNNTFTGHEEAENIAKNTAVQKNSLTKDKDPKELTKAAAENLLTNQQKQMRAQWETKFEAQPFTIIDNSWRGDEFVQVVYVGDLTEVDAELLYCVVHLLVEKGDLCFNQAL